MFFSFFLSELISNIRCLLRLYCRRYVLGEHGKFTMSPYSVAGWGLAHQLIINGVLPMRITGVLWLRGCTPFWPPLEELAGFDVRVRQYYLYLNLCWELPHNHRNKDIDHGVDRHTDNQRPSQSACVEHGLFCCLAPQLILELSLSTNKSYEDQAER